MSELQSYEKILKRKNEGAHRWKLIGWLFGYLNWVLIGSLCMAKLGMSAPILILLVLSTVILIRCTWKYTQVEWEYTLLDGILILDKIYGKKTRRSVFEGELKQAVLIAPYTEDFMRKAEEKLSVKKTIDATASEDTEDGWFLLFEEEGDGLIVLLEADETMVRIFRQYNARATARRI